MTGLLDDATSMGTDGVGRPDELDPTGARGLPVVTLGGDDAAGVHEVVEVDGTVTGFSLEKRSLFGGMLEHTLPVGGVHAIGPDAVVVVGTSVFEAPEDVEPLGPSMRTGEAGREARPAAAPALFSEVRRRDVVADDTGEAVGRVDRFIIDPVTATVGSIRLDNVTSDVRFLSWREVGTFGDDVVSIATGDVLRKPDGPREDGCRSAFRASGKLLLSDAGVELGEVADVEFDREDGRVTAFLLEDGARVDGSRLLGVGPYAVVVTA